MKLWPDIPSEKTLDRIGNAMLLLPVLCVFGWMNLWIYADPISWIWLACMFGNIWIENRRVDKHIEIWQEHDRVMRQLKLREHF